jgi:RNA polymerase sigma-70 factor, ECF subfamily
MNSSAQTSLETIWDKYCCRLLAFLRSRVSDDAEAEDLLQEVFMRVHYHLCCLPPPEKMDSWIYQIARNLVIDHYRRRRLTLELLPDLPGDTGFAEADRQAELALSLRGMVEQLPGPYREALLLTEFQGLSQVELAGRLGLSVSAAKSRVQRARRKLRDLLLACCHIELDRRGQVIDYYERCCICTNSTTCS